ncbi:putative MFS family arabinose efflux permease [Plasticicumulans lactativorans]|uniref:Putative MFS family arabinose efflux permease n=2 Tax=Plasticicumulans lactativorans TaxID=1133106 RepID=A0A4V2SD12_9GAMM|nr:putative MFS family arabinose efflux permease [Plasticicumulans lactativorans]
MTAHRTTAASAWTLSLAAAAILMITMGARQSLGLFVLPLGVTTGLGIEKISFALAVGQFVWGASQPLFGALADHYGSGRALVAGGLLLAAGLALTPLVNGEATLILSLGLLAAAGAGAGSFSILIGATASRLPPQRRAFASGFINAGGSFGQFVFAPLTQGLIAAFGWVHSMLTLALLSLLTLPLAWPLRRTAPHAPTVVTGGAAGDGTAPASLGMRDQLRQAFADRSYWCLHAGFFTCGFHIAFLVTHLPGEVNLCGLSAGVSATALAIIGLANVAGSLGAGALAQRYRMKWLLVWMYASRALIVALYLLAPKTALTFYVFAAALGVTWLATVPPTAGLVGKLFGTRYLATLFGMTLLSHQVGGFFGAWLGGIALARFGNFDWMWYADIALAAAAALVNLPIREAPVLRPALATA